MSGATILGAERRIDMLAASIRIPFGGPGIAIPALLALLMHAPDLRLAAQDAGWQPLVYRDGVDISFIVHRYGDGRNAGVVVRLVNTNRATASYRFRVIFRSDIRRFTSDLVEGVLGPLEAKTGELSGLWWIPFKDGSPVTEVGLKGLRIRLEGADDTSRPGADPQETKSET